MIFKVMRSKTSNFVFADISSFTDIDLKLGILLLHRPLSNICGGLTGDKFTVFGGGGYRSKNSWCGVEELAKCRQTLTMYTLL